METSKDKFAPSLRRIEIPTEEQFPCLESLTRPTVNTKAAAYYLNRKPQTLRCWAVYHMAPSIR